MGTEAFCAWAREGPPWRLGGDSERGTSVGAGERHLRGASSPGWGELLV